MSTNMDERAITYLKRLIRIEEERLRCMVPVEECVEDAKEVLVEMKKAEMTKVEIAGVKLKLKEHFEPLTKKVFRQAVEDFKESLGDFADMPLGRAAIERADA